MNPQIRSHRKQNKRTPPSNLSNLAQRRCSCGGPAGQSGECEACQHEHLTSSGGLLPKLVSSHLLQRRTIHSNQIESQHEKEANHLAELMIQMPPQSIVNSKLRKPLARGIKSVQSTISTSPPRDSKAPPPKNPGSDGRPLPNSVRSFFEPRLQTDLSPVRIHTDQRAVEAAHSIQARAFTLGNHIWFNQGQLSPHTIEGKRLLGHELTHVVQQSRMPGIGIQRARLKDFKNIKLSSLNESDIRNTNEFQAYTNKALVWQTELHLTKEEAALATRLMFREIQKGNKINWLRQARDFAWLARSQISNSPTIIEKNTDLGGLFVGNFDFQFKGCSIIISVRLTFRFSENISDNDQKIFKQRFFRAIKSVWTKDSWSLEGSESCSCSHVPIIIEIEEVSDGSHHKIVDVEDKSDRNRRPKVIDDINVNLHTDDDTLAHEFGHVLSLYDEYDGGWLENIMFWHKNRPDDKNTAVMKRGIELRPRYFEHFRKRGQAEAIQGCVYRISNPLPPIGKK